MRFSPRSAALVLTLAAAPVLAGCDSADGDLLAGTYETTRFLADTDDDARTAPTDVLALGGSVTMTLRADGTASGRIVVPASLAEDGEGDTPFAGTYAASGGTVTFDHEADTFVRDAAWTFAGGRLRTESLGLSVVLE